MEPFVPRKVPLPVFPRSEEEAIAYGYITLPPPPPPAREPSPPPREPSPPPPVAMEDQTTFIFDPRLEEEPVEQCLPTAITDLVDQLVAEMQVATAAKLFELVRDIREVLNRHH
jgi:hypothetical protein